MQARYIAEEVKDKSNKVIDTSSWHEEIADDIPLQQNGYVLFIVMILSFINHVPFSRLGSVCLPPTIGHLNNFCYITPCVQFLWNHVHLLEVWKV